MSGRGEPERVLAPAASANFFSLLGVEPVIGRTFQPGEDKPGAPRVTVLTYAMWQRRFGGDPGIVRPRLTLNGDSYTVIGVLPASFQFALKTGRPLAAVPTHRSATDAALHARNQSHWTTQAGVSAQQAQTELSAIAARIEQENKQSHAGTGLRFIPLQEQVVGPVKPILLVLLAAVGFVLLIACANVASLLLTRSLSRQKEVVAIRGALGRQPLARHQTTPDRIDSAFVGGWNAGCLDCLLGCRWTCRGAYLKPSSTPCRSSKRCTLTRGFSSSPSGFPLLTGIIFGLAPALQSSRLDLNEVLKEGGRNTGGGAGHRLRSALVMTEIALAVVLLVGAGLMMKSLLRLLQANVGFNPQNVLTMTVVLPPGKYNDAARQVGFHDQLKERVQSLPGVNGVGTVDNLPLQGGNTTRFNVEGDPIPPPGQEIEANFRVVNESYFQTLGVPLIAGRMFDERDKADAPGVVIIGKSLADRVFAGRDPIGRRLVYTSVKSTPDLIVGVVGDVKISGLDDAIRPVIYYPYRQNPALGTNLVVRTTGRPNRSGRRRSKRNPDPGAGRGDF